MEKRVSRKVILIKNQGYFSNFRYKKLSFFWMGWGSGPLMPSSGSAFREREGGREGGR